MSDVNRVCVSRKKKGRGLISTENDAIGGLEVYNRSSDERLIKTAKGDKIKRLEATSITELIWQIFTRAVFKAD